MAYESKPGAHIGNVCGCGEVAYCAKVFLAWSYIGGGDFEASKFNSVRLKYKFVRVEDDAIVAGDVEPLNCLEEALGEIAGPEKCVINALNALMTHFSSSNLQKI